MDKHILTKRRYSKNLDSTLFFFQTIRPLATSTPYEIQSPDSSRKFIIYIHLMNFNSIDFFQDHSLLHQFVVVHQNKRVQNENFQLLSLNVDCNSLKVNE